MSQADTLTRLQLQLEETEERRRGQSEQYEISLMFCVFGIYL